MEYQLVIYSTDRVFARMLELEFQMRGISTLVCSRPSKEIFSQIALLDLDSATPPSPDSYGRMIGFTRGEGMADEDVRRSCSMILHRPFEMRLLRREILESSELQSVGEQKREMKILLDAHRRTVRVGDGEVSLSPKEYAVIERLLTARGETVTRAELAAVIGESDANKTDVYVCYLRRKLSGLSAATLIRTVRGKGYMIP